MSFQANLGYMVRRYLKKKKRKEKFNSRKCAKVKHSNSLWMRGSSALTSTPRG
jgi:hypothetical protein